jgi:hypothetical protein
MSGTTGSLSDIIQFIKDLQTLDFYDAKDECCEQETTIELAKRCLMGGCWTWDQFVGYVDDIHGVYKAGNLPPAMVIFFTALAGFFGLNGNSDSLQGDDMLYPGLAIIMAIATGAMSALYVSKQTVENGMKAADKLRYKDYGGTDIIGDFAGIFVTLNLGLYFVGAAMLAIAPFYLTREAFALGEEINSMTPYTLMTMGVMVVAGEWGGAYALGEVASSLLGWFTSYRKTEVITSAGLDVSGIAFAVDVINQTILTFGYFMFAMMLPGGTWTYAYYLLTGKENWDFPLLAKVFPFSIFLPDPDAPEEEE